MKILTVDVGTGTQDIYLYDSRLDIENGFKMILPSPTMMVNHRLRQATKKGEAVLLTGFIMGGGPSAWAAEDHAKAGLPIYATPQAARSFNDDLEAVAAMGIKLVSEDEAQALPSSITRLELRDFDFEAIKNTFDRFGVSLNDLAAIAVAVFDHGNAPVNISDRQFRFDYLDARIRAENRLSAFAYRGDQVPPIMTRLQSVVNSAGNLPVPLVVMDTAPAAVLGATFDPIVSARPRQLVVNIGNFHTLAFRLGNNGIEGVFEHHTGLLTVPDLEDLIKALADGTLTHEQVFGHHGHGALIYNQEPLVLNHPDYNVVVTGPRRNLLRGSSLKPYFAVPFGDMMIAGCFGLLAAVADVIPELCDPIQRSLRGIENTGTAPWDVPI